MERCSIDISVVANIATKPAQHANVNAFAIQNDCTDLIHFGSVHPLGEDAVEWVEKIAQAGLKGIKLHPDYQGFYVDDPRVFPVYRKAMELGLVVLMHTGLDLGMPDPIHCSPKRLAAMLDKHPYDRFVAAHFGGWLMWEEVEDRLCGRYPLYLDTAVTMGSIQTERFVRMVEKHGSERVLFGSDNPWTDPARQLELISAAGLSPETEQAILSDNAARLLKL